VKRLLSQAIDPQPGEAPIDLRDPKQWESKTLASAVKQYLRELSKPLMTYQLYASFIAAVKHESEAVRLREIRHVVQQLPPANREILTVLIRHLSKVRIGLSHTVAYLSSKEIRTYISHFSFVKYGEK
jgi:rhodanese-related sulfurtransferase